MKHYTIMYQNIETHSTLQASIIYNTLVEELKTIMLLKEFDYNAATKEEKEVQRAKNAEVQDYSYRLTKKILNEIAEEQKLNRLRA